jgi:hypothetical protein
MRRPKDSKCIERLHVMSADAKRSTIRGTARPQQARGSKKIPPPLRRAHQT